MASKELTPGARRTDIWFCDPFSIKITEENRGRHKPPSAEAIVEKAISMLTHGQLQPVEVRRVDGDVSLVSGFTRAGAARLIRDGFEHDGQQFGDKNFMLQCKVVTLNEQEAFEHNVVENAHRDATSPIDDAHNQRRLREKYGYQNADIAKLYQQDPSRICKLKRLLEHDNDTQAMVHEGRLSVATAISLFELPPQERKAMIEAALLANGKVSSETIRKQVRAKHLADSEGDSGETAAAKEPSKTKFQKRSIGEVKKFFEDLRANHDDPVKSLAKRIVEWVGGRASDNAMLKSILKACGRGE